MMACRGWVGDAEKSLLFDDSIINPAKWDFFLQT